MEQQKVSEHGSAYEEGFNTGSSLKNAPGNEKSNDDISDKRNYTEKNVRKKLDTTGFPVRRRRCI
jgi:hypothetical protein